MRTVLIATLLLLTSLSSFPIERPRNNVTIELLQDEISKIAQKNPNMSTIQIYVQILSNHALKCMRDLKEKMQFLLNELKEDDENE